MTAFQNANLPCRFLWIHLVSSIYVKFYFEKNEHDLIQCTFHLIFRPWTSPYNVLQDQCFSHGCFRYFTFNNENIIVRASFISSAWQSRNYKQILWTRRQWYTLLTMFFVSSKGTNVLFTTNIDVVCVITTYNIFLYLSSLLDCVTRYELQESTQFENT